jgi:hypothetical protein
VCLRLPQLLYSRPGLHRNLLGMSHHMDPLKRSLNLYSSVQTIISFISHAVQHHTCNNVCSPCYGWFPLHLTHNN